MKKAGILIAMFLLAAAMLTGCMRTGDTNPTNTTTTTVTPTGTTATTAPRPSSDGTTAPTNTTEGGQRMMPRRVPRPMRSDLSN